MLTSIFSTIPFLILVVILKSIVAIPVKQQEEIQNVSCSNTLDSISTSRSSFVIRCPGNCLQSFIWIQGTTNYSPSSNLCAAGIHNGVITNDGGLMTVNVQYNWVPLVGSHKNGITSLDGLEIPRSFVLESVAHSSTSSIKATPTSAPLSSVSSLSTTTSTTTNAVKTLSTQPTVSSEKFYAEPGLTPNNAPQVSSTDGKPQIIPSTEPPSPSSTKSPVTSESLHLEELKQHNIQSWPDGEAVEVSMGHTEDGKIHSTLNFKVWIPGGIGVCVVLVLFATLLLWFCRTRKTRSANVGTPCGKHKLRSSSRGGVETCVCYVAVDSSVQALLHDPETCERPCELREKLQETDGQLGCGGHSGPQCDDCTGHNFQSRTRPLPLEVFMDLANFITNDPPL